MIARSLSAVPRLVLLFVGVCNLIKAEISITAFGAVPDGRTDNVAAIEKAFSYAAEHQGTKIRFPCTSGSAYLIRKPITFPPYTTIEGDNAVGCRILYDPADSPGTVHAAFSFVGSKFVTVRDLMFETGPANPPDCITQMGGTPGAAGQHIIENVSIKGFARKALSYSIASEVDTFRNVYWEYDGGGASYGFYTSGQDDLGICSNCQPASNLSLFFAFNVIVTLGKTPFYAIADKAGGGTEDHYYRDGYIGLNHLNTSAGFLFITGEPNQGGPNSSLLVEHVRIENGGWALYLKKAAQSTLSNLTVQGVSWVSSEALPAYFVYGESGLTLSMARMVNNIANHRGITASSSLDSLSESTLDESYGAIAVRRRADDNSFALKGHGSISLPAASSNNIVLEKGTERR